MKIVWLDQNQQLRIPMGIFYYHMQEAINKIAEVKFYGPGGGRFTSEFNVKKIVEKENPDVIAFWSTQLSFHDVDKTNIFRSCRCSDPHAPNFERHVKFLNSNNIPSAFLAVYETMVEKYKERCPNTYFWHSKLALDHNVWFDKGHADRPWDCSFVGSTGSDCYPMRQKIIRTLSNNSKIKFYSRHLDTKLVTTDQWDAELNGYLELLNRTKITPFSNGIFNYPVQRWHDAMACGCLVIAETPLDAEAMHFTPYYNYVPLDPNNIEKQVLFYLQNENERKRIVKNAHDTFLKYNTTEIRAREFIEEWTRQRETLG